MKEALFNLPETLDETYERMLTKIEKRSRNDALVLLRWIAYARSPPRLGELAEARIIEPDGDGSVDMDDRGGLEDSLDILSELVTVEGADDNLDETRSSGLGDSDSAAIHKDVTHRIQQVNEDTRVRFAHFSVKEYLESERILDTDANMFYLQSDKEHRFLAQSCLTYLLHYTCSEEKKSDKRDLTAFPLLKYAAQSWFYHCSLQQFGNVDREVSLLASEKSMTDWLLVHQPDWIWSNVFGPEFRIDEVPGSGLYYASFLGLEAVVERILIQKPDVNAQGGQYGNALWAASQEGHQRIVEMLIEAGADIDAQSEAAGNALTRRERLLGTHSKWHYTNTTRT